jgi:protein-L-isoaspartate(D-aspartate) O-methyltransferase
LGIAGGRVRIERGVGPGYTDDVNEGQLAREHRGWARMAAGGAGLLLGLAVSAWWGSIRADDGDKEYFMRAREAMVRRDIAGRGIRDETVLEAMGRVPREEFVLPRYRRYAYEDGALPIDADQTISQPYIVAAMTEALEVDADDRILEVGTGSGYQAAVLAELAGHVYTIEIIEQLADQARGRLLALGYTNVTVRAGDGYQGWMEEAPFDGVLVTAAPDHIPQPLIDQLKRGGRLVIPVGPQWTVQDLILIEKQADGSVRQRQMMPVRFVPLTGKGVAR